VGGEEFFSKKEAPKKMKITKLQLKQIIKEEISKILSEDLTPEKISQAREDATADARDDRGAGEGEGDRGDRWEFDEPEYLDVYLEAYDEAMEAMDRKLS